MPVFPQSERAIYQNNTLDEVVCQLRFPTILRIDAAPPVDFQESVRASFPLYVAKNAPELPPNVPPEFAQMLPANFPSSSSAFEFSTEDQEWKLSLTKEFIALTTSNYVQWEDFSTRLEAPLESLRQIYEPSFYVRIGLRYQNVINRRALGIEDGWRELIKEHMLGEIATESIGDRVEESLRNVLIRLENGGKVRLRHGLRDNNDEQVYIIDADYYTTQRTEVDNARRTLDGFNAESGNLFRWCITERLQRAMEP